MLWPKISDTSSSKINGMRTYLASPGDSDRLLLVGCFDLNAMQEVDFQKIAHSNGWLSPTRYQFDSIEDVVQAAHDLNPFVQRGFLLVDSK